ncbi:homeobox protein ceh-37-like [Adelges cooleyi]|uniref:homeobox protein ceh-37-like n=1 Tax=Adelges cooleyi TaxID=133065 RepID=UPI00217F999E|nr:homeobox protein ceh-37-like [Adelges cooleyi]
MSIGSSEPGSVFNMERNQIIEHRQRRKRTTYTLHQRNKLEELFNTTRYPNEILRQQLAETIEIDPYCVKAWFQNRRARVPNDSKLQNANNKLQNRRMNNIEPQGDLRGHQVHFESNNFTESLHGIHLNETSYGTINLRPDLEEQEEQTNISVYLKNFYEPKYDVYPIDFTL